MPAVRGVVFIDSRVPDRECLLGGVQVGTKAFLLDAEADGLAQIADVLSIHAFHDLSSISLVGHGSAGRIDLGRTVLDLSALPHHADTLARIGAALAEDGALLLYSCDVGQGKAGETFVAELSRLAGGVDVAAATHRVGSADLGASWTLDLITDSILREVPFMPTTLEAYRGVLSQEVWRQPFDILGGVTISSLVIAMDFTLTENWVLDSATAWVMDDMLNVNDGKLNDFSGISWGIYSDDGLKPAAPIYWG